MNSKHVALLMTVALSRVASPASGGADERSEKPSPLRAAPRGTKLDKTGTMWAPYLEWRLKNPSWSGNPFDLVATVTFKHLDSGEKRTTEMFYNGNNTWKFRFAGTRLGKWRFTTSSSDPDLDGQNGTTTINPNADPKISGFLTHKGNKFAIQAGNQGKLQGYLFTVYMERMNFDALHFADWDEATVRAYCDAAKQNGFEIIFVHVNNQWFKLGALGWNQHSSQNPDRATFEILENIITTAHQQGCRVHFWAWGDESRKWTPKGVPGGINGAADRRLQRYIAARLGPLPGWTMGYGFDLHEWTNQAQLNSWAELLHARLGWQHLLCARGQPLSGPHNINSYDGFGRDVPLATTRSGPRDYHEIMGDMDSDLTRPHFYEERHSHLREGFNLNMDGTRRLLWWETMAGGMGGFFGFYPRSPYPYPNPEQLRTHYTFWHTHKRFLLNMKPANNLTSAGGYVMKGESNKHYLFYKETTDTIQLDLTGMDGPQPAVAVETNKAYKEITLGTLKPKSQTIRLPSSSDWAIAVGDFGGDRPGP